uniref:branched-chain amino acid transport system II carrier protein n=1 Tax=Lacinutrix sp. TaxID=1937692 RepID=UPI0025C15600
IFRVVVLLTFIFSIPDVLNFITPSKALTNVINGIPLAKHSLGWVLPALISFLVLNIKTFTTNKITS